MKKSFRIFLAIIFLIAGTTLHVAEVFNPESKFWMILYTVGAIGWYSLIPWILPTQVCKLIEVETNTHNVKIAITAMGFFSSLISTFIYACNEQLFGSIMGLVLLIIFSNQYKKLN